MEGAILTTTDLRKFNGHKVYIVTALGRGSYIKIFSMEEPSIDYSEQTQTYFCRNAAGQEFSLYDKNVDAVDSKSNNYIFGDRKLAEEYLAWVKENTETPFWLK